MAADGRSTSSIARSTGQPTGQVLVIAMARGASGSALGTQFDDFLFASVHDERNGPLSVLSALARLDVDPWQTAAALAQLPRAAAGQRLASLFAVLPDGPADREAIAARLVAFLPTQVDSPATRPTRSTPIGRQANRRTASLVLIYVISTLVALGVRGLVEGQHPPPTGPAAQAPAAGSALSPPRPASARQ
jgi:hypothetical protein